MKRQLISRPRFAFWAMALCAGLLSGASMETQAQVRILPVRKSQADRDKERSNLNREAGALYLEGLIDRPIKARVTQAAPVYSNLTGAGWLGNLLPNQEVILLGVSEKAYRVRGMAQQGQVAGWIGKKLAEGVPPELEKNLAKLQERKVIVDQLIDKRQVALGMTAEEVIESIGEPHRRNSKVDKAGRSDTFEYVRYQKVPQTRTVLDQFGRPYQSVIYVEVETGKASVVFLDGVVSSIEESEGLNFQSGAIKLVPPPIIIF